jgi:hypothetical protein
MLRAILLLLGLILLGDLLGHAIISATGLDSATEYVISKN